MTPTTLTRQSFCSNFLPFLMAGVTLSFLVCGCSPFSQSTQNPISVYDPQMDLAAEAWSAKDDHIEAYVRQRLRDRASVYYANQTPSPPPAFISFEALWEDWARKGPSKPHRVKPPVPASDLQWPTWIARSSYWKIPRGKVAYCMAEVNRKVTSGEGWFQADLDCLQRHVKDCAAQAATPSSENLNTEAAVHKEGDRTAYNWSILKSCEYAYNGYLDPSQRPR